MKINHVVIITVKEVKETLKDRSLLSSSFSILLLIVLLSITRFKHLTFNMESYITYIALVIGFIVGFGLSSRFIKEKQEGVIETLLCTPLTLSELWLGKVIGLTILSYTITLISVIAISVIKKCNLTEVMTVFTFMVLPVLIASAIGLLGFLYYILGMRQIQLLNYMVFLLLFAIVFMVSGRLTLATWWSNWIMLALSLIVLSLIAYLTTRLSKERIITTLS